MRSPRAQHLSEVFERHQACAIYSQTPYAMSLHMQCLTVPAVTELADGSLGGAWPIHWWWLRTVIGSLLYVYSRLSLILQMLSKFNNTYTFQQYVSNSHFPRYYPKTVLVLNYMPKANIFVS